MLNQDAATPLYVQLMNLLEKDIQSGVYQPGDKLATETVMAKTYGVSLITVRKAIGALIEKDMVIRTQGMGTFVTKPKLARKTTLQSFTDRCTEMGRKSGAKMTQNCIVKASERVATALKIPVESDVVYIERIRFADDEPVQIERSYFTTKYQFLLDATFDDNSLFDFLRAQKGVWVTSSEKTVEICRATAQAAQQLEVKKGTPLLFVRSVAYDNEDDPLYMGIQIINGERFALHVYETAQK